MHDPLRLVFGLEGLVELLQSLVGFSDYLLSLMLGNGITFELGLKLCVALGIGLRKALLVPLLQLLPRPLLFFPGFLNDALLVLYLIPQFPLPRPLLLIFFVPALKRPAALSIKFVKVLTFELNSVLVAVKEIVVIRV